MADIKRAIRLHLDAVDDVSAEVEKIKQETEEAAQELEKQFDSAADKVARDLDRIGKKMQDVGERMKSVGENMTRWVTLPITAAGGAASTFAGQFEQGLKTTQAQAAITQDTIGAVGDAVEDTALRTGKSFDKIFKAQALAQSSFLETAEANELVTESAKASAAGFGNMERLINFSTSAFSKWQDTVGSSAEALNTIVGTANQVQAQMRNVIPAFSKGTASLNALNVGLGEGSALFGALADQARNTRAAGTQFSAMMSQLTDPTAELRDEIDQAFGSVDQFRESIEKDTIPTLFTLRDQIRESGKSFTELFGRRRAARGASNLFANDMERVNEILQGQRQQVDATGKAFQRSENFVRTASRAWNALKVALQPVGNTINDIIEPAFRAFINQAQAFAKTFESLSPTTRKFIVVLGGVAAAIGPVLVGLGTLSILAGKGAGALATLISTGGGVTTLFSTLSGILPTITGSLTSLIPSVGSLSSVMGGFTGVASGLVSILTSSLTPVLLALPSILTIVDDAFADITDGASRAFTAVVDEAQRFAESVGHYLGITELSFQSLINYMTVDLKPLWESFWAGFEAIVQTSFNLIVTTIEIFMETIGGVLSATMALIKGDWDEAWDELEGIGEDHLNTLSQFVSDEWDIIESFDKRIREIRDRFGQFATLVDALRGAFVNAFSAIGNATHAVFLELRQDFQTLSDFFGGLGDVITGGVGYLKEGILQKFNQVKTTVLTIVSNAVSTMEGIMTSIEAAVESIPGLSASSVPGISGAASGVRKAREMIESELSSTRDAIEKSKSDMRDYSKEVQSGWIQMGRAASIGSMEFEQEIIGLNKTVLDQSEKTSENLAKLYLTATGNYDKTRGPNKVKEDVKKTYEEAQEEAENQAEQFRMPTVMELAGLQGLDTGSVYDDQQEQQKRNQQELQERQKLINNLKQKRNQLERSVLQSQGKQEQIIREKFRQNQNEIKAIQNKLNLTAEEEQIVQRAIQKNKELRDVKLEQLQAEKDRQFINKKVALLRQLEREGELEKAVQKQKLERIRQMDISQKRKKKLISLQKEIFKQEKNSKDETKRNSQEQINLNDLKRQTLRLQNRLSRQQGNEVEAIRRKTQARIDEIKAQMESEEASKRERQEMQRQVNLLQDIRDTRIESVRADQTDQFIQKKAELLKKLGQQKKAEDLTSQSLMDQIWQMDLQAQQKAELLELARQVTKEEKRRAKQFSVLNEKQRTLLQAQKETAKQSGNVLREQRIKNRLQKSETNEMLRRLDAMGVEEDKIKNIRAAREQARKEAETKAIQQQAEVDFKAGDTEQLQKRIEELQDRGFGEFELAGLETKLDVLKDGLFDMGIVGRRQFEQLSSVAASAGETMQNKLAQAFEEGKFSAKEFGSAVVDTMKQTTSKILANETMRLLLEGGSRATGGGGIFDMMLQNLGGASLPGETEGYDGDTPQRGTTKAGPGVMETTVNVIGGAAQSAGDSAYSGLSTVLSSIPSFFGFDKGGAFSGGKLQRFAKGSVMDRPQTFAMDKGAGLMAEKGDEAIMPLSRNSRGELGVKSDKDNSDSDDDKNPQPIRIINVTDESRIEGYMRSSGGERAILNTIQENRTEIKEMIG